MEIKLIKTTELKPAEYNPRQLTEEQHQHLTESIKKFGMVDPIIVNEHKGRKNIIIGGHMRWRIAAELGFETVPVYYVDLTEEQEKELNVRLNKNTGEWNFEMLANIFDSDELVAIGFGRDELFFEHGGDESNVGTDRRVLTIEPPEAPRLKERISVHVESIADYEKIKKFVESSGASDIVKMLVEATKANG